jgi:hypothetical protein
MKVEILTDLTCIYYLLQHITDYISTGGLKLQIVVVIVTDYETLDTVELSVNDT